MYEPYWEYDTLKTSFYPKDQHIIYARLPIFLHF